MSEPLNTLAVGTTQAAIVTAAGAAAGVDMHLLQLFLGGVSGALFARVWAPIQDVQITALKAFIIFVASSAAGVVFGGFGVQYLVAHSYAPASWETRVAVAAAVGAGAQGIVEFVQAVPRLAQTNLVDAVKAIFARVTGKGAQ